MNWGEVVAQGFVVVFFSAARMNHVLPCGVANESMAFLQRPYLRPATTCSLRIA